MNFILRKFHKGIITMSLIILTFSVTKAQNYPQNYFRNPVDIPITLSGSFGELRFNHFHSGFDIRTNGAEGMPVYAAADGWISRIRVQGYNYGNALHICHPNGFTTLYGHMQRFSDEINNFVKKEQYRTQSFEQDIHPDAEKFHVKKGQLIGYSGNSGASRAPHLHFEIRETITEACINPMLFMKGMVKDIYPPVIKSIKIYPLDSHSFICVYTKSGRKDAIYGQGIIIDVQHQKHGHFVLSGVSKIEGRGTIGFAIRAVDHYSDFESTLAPFKVQLFADHKNIFTQQLAKVEFYKQNYINAHTDYPEFVKFNRWFERSYCLPHDSLDIYVHMENKGRLFISKDKINMSYVVKDLNDSAANLDFIIHHADEASLHPKKQKNFDTIFNYRNINSFSNANFKLKMQAYSLYDNMGFSFKVLPKKTKMYSDIYHVDDAYTPFAKDCDISINASSLPQHLRDKVCVMNDMRGYIGGVYAHDWVSASAKALGDFYLMVDTTAPSIHPVNISNGAHLGGKKAIIFTISDNLSGIKSFRATIDGHWILLKCDLKKLKYWYDFDEYCSNGSHIIELSVTDQRNNTRTESWKFNR